MSDAIQKRAGLPTVRPAKAALDSLRQQVRHQKIHGTVADGYEDLFICFDISGSMMDSVGGVANMTKLRAAMDAASALVEASTSSSCNMGLVTYGGTAHLLCEQTSNYNLLLAVIATIRPEGWTDIVAGLSMCAERLGRSSSARSKRIILLTDGREMPDPYKAPALSTMELVDKVLVPNGIVVDCIAFGRDADIELLEKIARKTGGKCVTVYQEIELKKAFLQLETGVRGLLTAENK